jgi:hypothetical protein
MLFAAITHLLEGLSLDTFFTLKVEKSLICFVGICKPTVSITEQQLILFLKTIIIIIIIQFFNSILYLFTC